MSTVTLDLINDLLLAENTGHVLSVKAHDSTGEYEDSASGILTLYKISEDGVSANLSMAKDKTWAVQGRSLQFTLTAASGFILPQNVGVFVNGVGLSSGFSYDPSTGVINIQAAKVTGIVAVTARGARTVTFSGVGVSSSGAEYVADNADYSAIITADYGFSLPDSITVKIGGVTLASSNYSWNSSTGVLNIPQNKITGAVSVTANAKVPVTFDGGDHLDITGPERVELFTAYSCTISVKSGSEGYVLPNEITVTVGGQALESSAYTWSKGSGAVTVGAAYVTGALVITAEAGDVPSLATPTLVLNNSDLTIIPDDSCGKGNQFLLYKDSESSPSLTLNRFAIGSDEYFCEAGMTWLSWAESDFNTNGFTCASSSSSVIKNATSVKYSETAVKGYDTISAGRVYTLTA